MLGAVLRRPKLRGDRREAAYGLRLDQRHVAAHDDDGIAGIDGRHGLLHGMPGAELRLLLDPLQVTVGEGVADPLATVTVNNDDARRVQ